MALTTCFSCGRKVSTLATVGPDPACGLSQPGEHHLHEQLAAARAGAAAADESELPFEARVRAALDGLASQIDRRPRAELVAEQRTCRDCETSMTLDRAVGRPCETCGCPDLIACGMPSGCDRSAARLGRVSGRWLVICDRHGPCVRCGEIVDESRHVARVEIDPSRLARPGRGLSSRVRSAARKRLYSHVDPVVCEAFVWLRELNRLGITVAAGPKHRDAVSVAAVASGSAGAAAGLSIGQVVVQIGAVRVSGLHDLVGALASTPAHRTVALVLSQEGAESAVAVELPEPTSV